MLNELPAHVVVDVDGGLLFYAQHPRAHRSDEVPPRTKLVYARLRSLASGEPFVTREMPARRGEAQPDLILADGDAAVVGLHC